MKNITNLTHRGYGFAIYIFEGRWTVAAAEASQHGLNDLFATIEAETDDAAIIQAKSLVNLYANI